MHHRFVQWVTVYPRCNPPVCAVGDHVLPESTKEQVKNT